MCAPYLKKGKNPHILNLSPPLSLQPRWFANHVAYTIAKYNMSLCALGWSEEFKSDGIAANCLWPATAINTAAMEMIAGGSDFKNQCRTPEIMADAAYVILSRDSKQATGYFYVDENVLKEEGFTDLKIYQYDAKAELMPDFFLEGLDTVHSSKICYLITCVVTVYLKIKIIFQLGQYNIARQGVGAAPPQPVADTPSASPASSAGSSGDGGEIIQIFTKIKKLMDPDMVKKTNAIFQFDVKGDDGGLYYLDLKSGDGAAGKGESPAKSDVTIAVSQADFVKLFAGKLSPTSALVNSHISS
jgi:putative sterol carrier protein